jgi:hypothetical protein
LNVGLKLHYHLICNEFGSSIDFWLVWVRFVRQPP